MSDNVEIVGLKKDVEYIKKTIDEVRDDFREWKHSSERVARESQEAKTIAYNADVRSKQNTEKVDAIEIKLIAYDTTLKNIRYLIGTVGLGTLVNIFIWLSNNL